MFEFGRKHLSISDKEYELIEAEIHNLLELREAEMITEDFLVAGGTSVFIKKYRIDKSYLSVSLSDDGSVTIVGSKDVMVIIKSYLD